MARLRVAAGRRAVRTNHARVDKRAARAGRLERRVDDDAVRDVPRRAVRVLLLLLLLQLLRARVPVPLEAALGREGACTQVARETAARLGGEKQRGAIGRLVCGGARLVLDAAHQAMSRVSALGPAALVAQVARHPHGRTVRSGGRRVLLVLLNVLAAALEEVQPAVVAVPLEATARRERARAKVALEPVRRRVRPAVGQLRALKERLAKSDRRGEVGSLEGGEVERERARRERCRHARRGRGRRVEQRL